MLFVMEIIEPRSLLNAAFDLIGLTALRNDPAFSAIDGSDVSVAVIDTGLDTTHPLISPNYLAGADIAGGGSNPTVTNPHGTHVAGIIGSRPDPARGYEGGVAPRVGIIALNVFTQGAGGEVASDNRNIEKALQWVLDNRAKYRIVAVNMSLGSGVYTSTDQVQGDVYRDEIQRLEGDGVTVVSAAGNSYGVIRDPSTGQQVSVQFPNSAAPGIVSTLDVGAVWDANEGADFMWGSGSVDLTTGPDRLTSFSQRPPAAVGNGIFAPGAIITSTWPGNQLQRTQGTSQAAPMVSGAVALLQDAAQTFGGRLLASQEVRSVLQSTGDTITDGDNEDDAIFVDANRNGAVDPGELTQMVNTGLSYARLNIYKAVRKIREMFGGGTTGSADPNGTISNAILGPTLSGSPVDAVEGTLGADGAKQIGDKDIDLYQFTVASPGVVTVELSSSKLDPKNFDSYLRLFDSTGAQVAANENAGTNPFSQIKITLAAGTYYAGVSGAGNTSYDPLTGSGAKGGATGNFLIGFSLKNVDPNGLISGAVNVNLAGAGEGPQVFNGYINADFGKPVGVSDVDLFKIVVPDNGKLMVDVDTPFQGGYVDSYLRMFDSNGNPIGANNNAVATDAHGRATETTDNTYDFDAATGKAVGHATDSFAIASVKRGEVYYFGVSDLNNTSYDPNTLTGRTSGGTGGFYTISVGFANNDQNGSIAGAIATPLPLMAQAGAIGSDLGDNVGDRDVDMFRITLTTDGLLEINVDSYSLSGNANPVNSVLKLFDGHGMLLASSDDVNGPDPLIRIRVPKNRAYYVGVSGYGNASYDPFVLGSGSPGQTGSYQIHMQIRSKSLVSRLWDDRIGAGNVKALSLGSRLNGNLGMDGSLVRGGRDVDLYRFVAPSTGPIEVRARSLTSFGADTVLRVFNSTGRELAFNDNADASTVDSRVQMSVRAGRTYYLGVGGASKSPRSYDAITGTGATPGSTGDYVISLDGGFATLSSGRLRAYGTTGNDAISVRSSRGRIKITRNGSTLTFPAAAIKGLAIAAGKGNDSISIGAGVIRATIDGGPGTDTVRGSESDDVLLAIESRPR